MKKETKKVQQQQYQRQYFDVQYGPLPECPEGRGWRVSTTNKSETKPVNTQQYSTKSVFATGCLNAGNDIPEQQCRRKKVYNSVGHTSMPGNRCMHHSTSQHQCLHSNIPPHKTHHTTMLDTMLDTTTIHRTSSHPPH